MQRGKRHVVVTAADTGTGIAPQHLPHSFERFYRSDVARARAGGGSGRGLAIVRQIVDDHHGTLTADSTVGVGTTVTVRIPQQPRNAYP